MAKAAKGKQVKAIIKLQIVGGSANPAPPIGPALGQRGVNIMQFCKEFNACTNTPDRQGKPLPVLIRVFEDKSFEFDIKMPTMSYMIKTAAGLTKGSSTTSKQWVGSITWRQVEEIAKVKMVDLTAATLEAAMRSVAGSARSMGIKVEEDRHG